MEKSNTIAKLTSALVKFQAEVNNPVNTKVNTFLKNKYAPLDVVLNTVRPILTKHGLSIFQEATNEADDKISVITTLFCEDEWLTTEPIAVKPEKQNSQQIGSAITYLRRYTLSAALGISSEDDNDGNTEGKKPSTNKTNPVDKKIKELKTLAKTKMEKDEKNSKIIGNIIKKHYKDEKGQPSANYNKIESVEILQKIIDELNQIK